MNGEITWNCLGKITARNYNIVSQNFQLKVYLLQHTFHAVGNLHHFILHVVQTLHDKVQRLESTLGVLGCYGSTDVEIPVLWFVGDAVLQLLTAREKPGTVGSQLTSTLPTHTKLNRVPVELEETKIVTVTLEYTRIRVEVPI